MSSTAPFLPSTKPLTRPDPPGTCCPYVAPGCSWHAQVRPLTTPLGRNFPTETWSGRLHSVGPTARGSLSGCASAATQPSTPTTLCCRCCQTAPCVQRMARESSPSTCARAVEVGFVVEEPRRKSSPAHPCVIVIPADTSVTAATAPPYPSAPEAGAWYAQAPPPPQACRPHTVGFFVPLLHASTRRLHHQAEGAWEASRLRVLVHALQTTQQLAVADGRSLPPGEAHLLQSLHREALPAAHLAGRLHPCVSARGYPSVLPRPPASLVQSLDQLRQHAGGPAPPAPPNPGSPHASSSTSSSSSRSSSRQPAQFAAASPAPSPADEDALPVAASVARHPIGLRGRQLWDAFASLDAHDASAMLRQPCHMFRTCQRAAPT